MKDKTFYKIRVTAVNELGDSVPEYTISVQTEEKLVSPSIEIEAKTLESLKGKKLDHLRHCERCYILKLFQFVLEPPSLFR